MKRLMVGGVVVAAACALVPASASAVTCTTPPTVEVRQDAGRTITPNCGAGLRPFLTKTTPAHGHLEGIPFSLGAAIRYVPDAGYLGPDSFSYTADGPGGESDQVTQAIIVNTTANVAPHCTDVYGTQVVRQGTPATFTVTCTDDDGDPIALALDAPGPQFGTGTITPQGAGVFSVQYATTSPGGVETVSLTASDGHGGTAPSTITVDAVSATANHAPTCAGYALTTGPWFGVGVSANNCSDADGDPLTLELVRDGSHGHATVNPAATAIDWVVSDDAFRGSDQFVYRAVDDHGAYSAPATIDITVRDPLPPSSCHTGKDPGDPVPPDTDTDFLLSCYPGDDGLPLTFTIDAAPAHGTLTMTAANRFRYRPQSGYTGPDGFSFHATGPHGMTSAVQQVSYVVQAASAPSGGGTGGGGGGLLGAIAVTPQTPAPTTPDATPPAATPAPPAATAPSQDAPAAPKPPRSAGLDLGDTTALLAPGVTGSTATASASGVARLLVIRCPRTCRVNTRPELLLGSRHGKAHRLRLPRRSFVVHAGRSATIALRLTHAVKRRLGHRTSVRARVKVSVRDASGTATDARTFRVRVQPRR